MGLEYKPTFTIDFMPSVDIPCPMDHISVFLRTCRLSRIDVIICNAGVMAVPTRCETSDGFEMQSGSPRGTNGGNKD